MRKAFRKDLPSYDIPQCSTKPNTKRKLTGNAHHDGPPQKKSKQDQHTPSKTNKKKSHADEGYKQTKTVHTRDPTEIQGSPLKFHPVDEHWQQTVCDIMGLHFHGKNRVRPGGPNIPLTPPDMRTVKHIKGDGNCLFRALAYIITGSEEQHMAVRRAILQHIIHIAHFIIGHHVVEYASIQEYIADKNMDQEYAWGTDIEMLILAHLLQTPIMSYSVQHRSWQRYAPHDVDRTLTDNILQTSMYLVHACNHFEVACSVRKSM